MADPDLSKLDRLIASLRGARGFLVRAAPAVAKAVEAELRATAAAGTTPDGAAWAPKKDGGRALANAAAAISVRAVGTVILARLRFPESIHHKGTKRLPKRQILPEGELPANVAEAIKRTLVREWEQAVRR